MSRTGWSGVAAAALALLAGGVFTARWWLVGPQLERPRGASTWEVTLEADGQLRAADTTLATARPPNFRQQHVFADTFQGEGVTHRRGKGRREGRPLATWTRSDPGGRPAHFHLTYRFRVVLGMHRPTVGMAELTQRLDAPPGSGEDLGATPHVQSDSRELADKANLLVAEVRWKKGAIPDPAEKVRALFDYVGGLEDRPQDRRADALGCLRAGGGNALARARLLIALCRSQTVPARLVTGLTLLPDQPEPTPHYWAEAWVGGRWEPLDPAGHHFGEAELPKNYLVLRVGSAVLLRGPTTPGPGGRPALTFRVQPLSPMEPEGGSPARSLRALFQKISLYNLRPDEQRLARFLLFLPLAALVVSVSRTMIGVKTFGTFGPALLGLAFLDLRALPWGLGIFVGVVLVGWMMRHALDPFHLLLVPRTAILLTLIVSFLLVLVVVLNWFNVWATHYIALFPLVILTHLVERFWTVEAEDGTAASFRTLLGTLFVAASISVLLNPEPIINAALRRLGSERLLAPEPLATWMLGHPETLLLVLAAQFLIGRYTGYRLSELYRFRDLIEEPATVPQNKSGEADTVLLPPPARGEGDKEARPPAQEKGEAPP